MNNNDWVYEDKSKRLITYTWLDSEDQLIQEDLFDSSGALDSSKFFEYNPWIGKKQIEEFEFYKKLKKLNNGEVNLKLNNRIGGIKEKDIITNIIDHYDNGLIIRKKLVEHFIKE